MESSTKNFRPQMNNGKLNSSKIPSMDISRQKRTLIYSYHESTKKRDSSNGNRNLIKQTRRAAAAVSRSMCKKTLAVWQKSSNIYQGQEMKQWHKKHTVCTELCWFSPENESLKEQQWIFLTVQPKRSLLPSPWQTNNKKNMKNEFVFSLGLNFCHDRKLIYFN